MRPAVVVVCINSVYNNAHGYCNPWHGPNMRTAPIKIRRQLQCKTQRTNGKHKRIIERFLPAENIHIQRGGIELEAEAACLALRGPSTADLRLSMSATGAPASLTLGRQPTTSCYIIRLLPTADNPVLEALLRKLPHSTTDLCFVGAYFSAFDRYWCSSHQSGWELPGIPAGIIERIT